MKKLFKTTLLSLIVLASCGGGKEFTLYKNSEPIKDGDVTIKIDRIDESTYLINSSYRQYTYISFVSSNTKPVTLRFKDWKVYREKDNAEYGASCITLITGELNLECDKETKLSFTTETPTSFTEDNYKLVAHYDSKTLVCHLYNSAA